RGGVATEPAHRRPAESHGLASGLAGPSEMRHGADRACEHVDLAPLSEIERRHVELTLEHCQGNLSETARALGIGRTTLYRKLEKYRIRSRCS
ncbi:MAG: helix-turn-helix domain-containing protein, partial [Candidatus Binatia bacterium]